MSPLWSKALLSYSVVLQSLSHMQLFATPWTAASQASLPFTISCILLRLMSIDLVLLSNQLILCCPLLLLPLIFPSIRFFFSNESALCIRWPKYWSFSISPSNEYSGLISFKIIQNDSQVLPRVHPSPPPWCQLLSLSPLACATPVAWPSVPCSFQLCFHWVLCLKCSSLNDHMAHS